MSEHDDQHRLTRREIRLREMAAAAGPAAPPIIDDAVASVTATEGRKAAHAPPEADQTNKIDISLRDETGRMRSRRELRELRLQAEATFAVEERRASAVSPDAAAASPEPPMQQYSFPDIAPLDENTPVFDNPAARLRGASAAPHIARDVPEHDFDELIGRAIAKEGAVSATNTSALIIPTLPEQDTLAAPISETGEMLVTASIKLPRLLGETGEHEGLQGYAAADHVDENDFTVPSALGELMEPISASRAVSTREVSGMLISQTVQDKSKKPVILMIVGGVMVLGAAGLIVWAAQQGLFG